MLASRLTRKPSVLERFAGRPIILVSTLALAACGSSDEDDAGAGAELESGGAGAGGESGGSGGSGLAGGGGSSSGGAAAASEVILASDLRDFATSEPVEGAEICVLDSDPAVCSTTDAFGAFELPVPPNSQVAITATADGYMPEIFQLESEAEDFTRGGYIIPEEALTAQLLSVIGQEFDPTKGQFSVSVDSADVSYEIDPPSGDEPFYLVGASITAGDPATPAPGFTGIINIDPGDVTLTMTHPTMTCSPRPGGGWPIEPGVETVVIRAGFLTGLTAHECM